MMPAKKTSLTITTPLSPATDGPPRQRPAPATLTTEFESWKAACDARR